MSRKAYSDNPQSVQTPQDVDYMGIENGGTGLPYMKKVQVGNLLQQERDRLDDLETNKANKSESYKRNEIDAKLDTKVDKVAGRGLSDENYTLDEKNKVANVPNDTNAELDLKESVANVEAHKNAIMPHQFVDESTGKIYRYGQRLSVNKRPQTLTEEII